ncbi:hypothetical protein QUF74_12080 [Candidatus Halobeggiatoa sp. HSG11]|nr:hypothetical protein [Candidatus Halobeggiatoa sp. HSG11]
MSHKPNDTKSEQVVSTSNGQSGLENLDTKLRAAESSLKKPEVSKSTSPQNLVEGAMTSGGSMHDVRELLFGGQMRDYDKRFKRLEERFNQENMHFREDMFQRLKVLEERVEGELDVLDDKVKIDRQERQTGLTDLEHGLKTLKNELTNRTTQLDEQFSKEIKTLRQQMHSKIQEISLQTRQQNENVVSMLNKEVAQLHDEKVDRAELATFFTELAGRMSSIPTDKTEIE